MKMPMQNLINKTMRIPKNRYTLQPSDFPESLFLRKYTYFMK